MRKYTLLVLFLVCFSFVGKGQGIVKDIDGNVYKTIRVGGKVWMAENLRVTHYNNGDTIQKITDGMQWAKDTISGAYCYYSNNIAYTNTYGALYNWYTVIDNRNVCPTGWHVPHINDWEMLISYYGGNKVAGGKMKDTTSNFWNSPNKGATNSNNFTALPAGFRFYDKGQFYCLKERCYWWSTTETIDLHGWYCNLRFDSAYAIICSNPKNTGFSIRCLTDTLNNIQILNYKEDFKITPNPATNFINISGELKVESYKIFDVTGKEILMGKNNLNNNTINISLLDKGIYFVRVIVNDNKVYNSKFIKN